MNHDFSLKTYEGDFGRGLARWHETGTGNNPQAYFLSANGHAVSTYSFFLKRLADTLDFRALENRAAWPNSAPPTSDDNWPAFLKDYYAFMNQYESTPSNIATNSIHIGHSLGASLGLQAALNTPEKFRRLIMIDPGTLPSYWQYVLYNLASVRRRKEIGFIKATGKRRSTWNSKQAFIDYVKVRKTYSGFCDEALNDYANGGLVEKDGQYHLRFSGQWEAHIFTSIIYVWPLLAKLRIPTLLLRGEHSHIFHQDMFEKLCRRYNRKNSFVTVKQVDNVGHMAIQDDPDQVAHIIKEWLNKDLDP